MLPGVVSNHLTHHLHTGGIVKLMPPFGVFSSHAQKIAVERNLKPGLSVECNYRCYFHPNFYPPMSCHWVPFNHSSPPKYLMRLLTIPRKHIFHLSATLLQTLFHLPKAAFLNTNVSQSSSNHCFHVWSAFFHI